ncbi:hypothetical protein Hanom_Chr07g00630101 [Helianthus anomalus]
MLINFMSFTFNIFLAHPVFYATICFTVHTNPILDAFVKSFITTFHQFYIPLTKLFWIFCLSFVIQLFSLCPQ